MPKFKYVALDQRGRESQGEIEADTQTAALSKIREKGLFPTSVSETGSPASKSKKTSGGSKSGATSPGLKKSINIKLPKFLEGKVKTKQLMTFTRQLATLVDAGLPLVRSLTVLERQERVPALKTALSEMAESIQSGSTFAEALAQHPKTFDKLYVNMINAGEAGGVLDLILAALGRLHGKGRRSLRRKSSAP